MLIEHISVSRAGVWQQCKALYKYKYHHKIPSPEVEPFYFVYGKMVHKIAEEYVRNNGEKAIGEIAYDVVKGKIFLEHKANGPINLPQEYKDKLPEHLKSVVKLFKDTGPSGLLEMEFNYDLDPPNERKVKGFIDRVVIKNDNYFIFDYKTSKKNKFRKTTRTITKDLQLRIYARVIQNKFNVPAKNIWAALYYLEGSDLIGCQFCDETLVEAEKELLDVFKQIEETPPESAWGNVGPHCQRCDYRSICPHYKSTWSH